MKLSPEAIIAKPKLNGYLLKLLPQDDKSQYLQQAGFTLENWQDLEKALRGKTLSKLPHQQKAIAMVTSI